MNRIVCIGNQFVQGDDFGVRVYERLVERNLPEDIQVINGGIAGLNLLGLFDGCKQLVFVDNVGGDISPHQVLVLEEKELATNEVSYSHASGLGYILQAHRAICHDDQPRIFLVGAGMTASEKAVSTAVNHCIRLAQDLVIEQ